VVPAGAMTALGGKPQTTRKANILHALYATQGSKPIIPSPVRGRGNRAGDPARGYLPGSPNLPALKGTSPLQGRGGGQIPGTLIVRASLIAPEYSVTSRSRPFSVNLPRGLLVLVGYLLRVEGAPVILAVAL